MKIRNGICILLFSLLVLFFASGTSSAASYQITDQELTQFEENYKTWEQELMQVKNTLTILKLNSAESKKELLQANQELDEALSSIQRMKSELKILKEELQASKIALDNANQLFKEYEKEAKRTQRRLTRQRNTVVVVGGILITIPVVGLIKKAFD